MMSAKESVIEFIRALPEVATYVDVLDAVNEQFGLLDDEGEEFDQEQWDKEWVEEINRRIEDVRSGKSVGIPNEEVDRRMREKYG